MAVFTARRLAGSILGRQPLWPVALWPVAFLTDGAIEFHWAERDVDTGFKMKQFVNPMARGHFCFRTDDIKGFMRKCDELGICYSDYGKWAIAGWHQVFLQDPDGNVVEVHQPNMF